MKMKKIELDIENPRIFTQIAALVDQSDFIQDLLSWREKLDITSFPYNFKSFSDNQIRNIVFGYKRGLLTSGLAVMAIRDYCLENKVFLADIDTNLAAYYVATESLVKKYRKSNFYKAVILSALLCNEVSSDDFIATNIISLNRNTLTELTEQVQDTENIIAIRVTPESELKEIKATYDFIRAYYFGKQSKNKSKTISELYFAKTTEFRSYDTKTEIKRDREWYWRNIDGESYEDIWKTLSASKRGVDHERIKKAVQAYKRLLIGEI